MSYSNSDDYSLSHYLRENDKDLKYFLRSNEEALKYFIKEVTHILGEDHIQRFFGARKRKDEHKSIQGDLENVGDPILTNEDCINE